MCGVDNEVAAGGWTYGGGGGGGGGGGVAREEERRRSAMISGAVTRSAGRAFGFRADGRVVGMARRQGGSGEEVAVVSETGAFYLLRRR